MVEVNLVEISLGILSDSRKHIVEFVFIGELYNYKIIYKTELKMSV